MRLAVLLFACAVVACSPPSAEEAPAAPSVETWDSQLIALMPQIDACIAASSGATWVSYAGPAPSGGVLVRLTGDGGGFDCTVDEGATTAASAMRDENLTVPGEREAIFVRAVGGDTVNPGGACYEAPEVRSADNELLGWMMDPLGC